MDEEAKKAYEKFREMLNGQTPKEFIGEQKPWKRPEDSPLYVDLSNLNAVSNEFGVITTFPMHRRRFEKSKYMDTSIVLTGQDKCRVMGHNIPSFEPESKCLECGRSRSELESTGEIWDGKGELKGVRV